MTQLITDRSSIQFTSPCSTEQMEPAHVWNLRVSTSIAALPQGDVYIHGVRLHALLSRVKDHEPLNALERRYLPFLDAIRTELRLHGVSYLRPEQTLSHPKLGHGRCDFLLEGGLAPQGLFEMKCIAEMPNTVRHADLMQLGRYAAMLSHPDVPNGLWGCIAYVSIRSRAVRIFAYSDLCNVSRRFAGALAA